MTFIVDGTSGLTFPNSTVQASAGQVLQVVSTTSTTTFSSTSTTPVDITGLSVSITPKFSTSKVLVVFSTTGSATDSLNLYLNRNGTNIDLGSGGSAKNATISSVPTGNSAFVYSYSAQYLDSPATTSAVTYKIQSDTNAGTFYIGRRGSGTDFNSPSSITVMEIAG
jgi:hypothetical protein